MTSTSERTVTNRALCEFLWNALGLDPDNVVDIRIYPDKVEATQYVRNSQGGLVIQLPDNKVMVEEVEFEVVHDG